MGKAHGEPVTFDAVVNKVQTLVDNGIRVTLDLPETEILAMAWLAECKRDGLILSVQCTPTV
jgi:hypothetical protein